MSSQAINGAAVMQGRDLANRTEGSSLRSESPPPMTAVKMTRTDQRKSEMVDAAVYIF
jgi:hypothetical protein